MEQGANQIVAHRQLKQAMLDINLKGAWMVARRIIPIMIAQRSGVIINNSSVAGLRGMNRLSHYAMADSRMVRFFKVIPFHEIVKVLDFT